MATDGKRRSKLRIVLDFLKNLLGKEPAPPDDPDAYVMAPLRPGPKGRSGAAVAEIEEDSNHNYPPRYQA